MYPHTQGSLRLQLPRYRIPPESRPINSTRLTVTGFATPQSHRYILRTRRSNYLPAWPHLEHVSLAGSLVSKWSRASRRDCCQVAVSISNNWAAVRDRKRGRGTHSCSAPPADGGKLVGGVGDKRWKVDVGARMHAVCSAEGGFGKLLTRFLV